MAKDKRSFILYCDLIHTVRKLPKDKAGELFMIILSYVNDENPVVEDVVVDLVFEPVKQQLKRDLKTWERYIKKQSDNGKLGGRPAKNPKKPSLLKKSQKSQANPSQPKKAENVNVTVNDTVTVKEERETAASPPPFKKISETQFYESLKEFVETYPKEMLRSFFNYWSEKDEHGKMKFQLQKTWELKKRLINWSSKNFEDFKNNNGVQKNRDYPTGPTLPILNKPK